MVGGSAGRGGWSVGSAGDTGLGDINLSWLAAGCGAGLRVLEAGRLYRTPGGCGRSQPTVASNQRIGPIVDRYLAKDRDRT